MTLSEAQLRLVKELTDGEADFERVVKIIEIVNSEELSEPSDEDKDPEPFAFHPDQLTLVNTVISDLPISIFVKNTEGQFLVANRITLNDLGNKTLEEVIGKSDFDFLEEDDATYHYNEEQSIMQGGDPILNQQLRIDAKDGGDIWYVSSKLPLYDEDGNIVGLVGVNQDVTEQKTLEIQLRQERNLLRLLIDNVKDQIYIKDRQGRILIANQATLRNKPVDSVDDIIGKTDFDHLPYEEAKKFWDEEQRLMETGDMMIDKEYYTGDNDINPEAWWYLTSKIPLRDKDGQIIGLVGVNRDITEQKIATAKTMEVELEQQKSKFLYNFITDVSHEFRTPLSIIDSATYLLEKKMKTDDDLGRYLQQIAEQSEHIENLIDSMLFMAKLDRTEIKPTHLVNCKYLIQRAVDDTPDKHLIQIIDKTTETYQIPGNESILFRALRELIDNAVEAVDKVEGQITVSYESDGQRSKITIADNGIGMSKETQKQVFQRFYRQEPARTKRGLGLGLSIVHRIIQLHQGIIIVESELGVGSKFTVTLPHTSK